jgi:hypothetical protein
MDRHTCHLLMAASLKHKAGATASEACWVFPM